MKELNMKKVAKLAFAASVGWFVGRAAAGMLMGMAWRMIYSLLG